MLETINAAGVTFGNGQKILKRIKDREFEVKLVREPDNRYDENAIAIILRDLGTNWEGRVGYVKKEENVRIGKILGSAKVVEAKVIGGDNGKSFGLLIKLATNGENPYDVTDSQKELINKIYLTYPEEFRPMIKEAVRKMNKKEASDFISKNLHMLKGKK